MFLSLLLLLAQSPQVARVAELLQNGELMEADRTAVQIEQCTLGIRRDLITVGAYKRADFENGAEEARKKAIAHMSALLEPDTASRT